MAWSSAWRAIVEGLSLIIDRIHEFTNVSWKLHSNDVYRQSQRCTHPIAHLAQAVDAFGWQVVGLRVVQVCYLS